MKPLIRITGPLRCCLSLLQSRRRRRRRLDDPSPFPIVMILPFSSSKGGRSGSCSGRQHKSPPFAISWNHLHVSLPNSLTMILEDLIQTFSEVPKNINFVQRNNRLCWKFNKRGKPMIIDLGL
nr:uncharacterized protein LOC112727955 isoform X2 [Arachis hypogaea]